MSRQRLPRFIAILLLWLLAFLQLSSLAVTSVTIDEPSHLVAGYAFLTRGDTRIKLNGPILPNALGAVPLLLQPDLKLTPADDPMWDQNDHNGISDDFVWHNAASPFLLIYLARLPFIFIGWLLGALIFRWASERAGAWAGVFALALYVFDPNLLAHSRFAMTDFVPAAIACFALYSFDRWLPQTRNRKWLVTTGVLTGLMLASKFSLIMFALPMVILVVLRSIRSAQRMSVLIGVLFIFAIAAFTIWVVYGLQIGPIDPGGTPVPAPGFWREWQSAQYYLNQPWPNYLFGQTSETGWWYYFPIALVLKTPLPLLVLFSVALIRTVLKRTWHDDLGFLLPSLFLFSSLLFSTNNLGYRYLLPVLPLVIVYVAGLWPRSVSQSLFRFSTLSPAALFSARHLVTLSLLAWQVIGTLRIYPYYLTYFNEITGGPDRGRYLLSDSNLDWGQDLVGLRNYVEQNNITSIKLSYFGIAHPAAYGLHTQAIPPIRTAMHDQGAWWLKTYYPSDPPPGKYAISVANLMGGIWIEPATYAFFRDRQPETTIGNSIYVYTIARRGEPVNLSLAGLQIDQIDLETYRMFGTNDVRPRWFDATSSLIAAPGSAWIAIADNQPLAPEFAAFFAGAEPIAHTQVTDEDRAYGLYHFDLARRIMQAAQQATPLSATFGDTAELLGYNLKRNGHGLTFITYWRAGDQVVAPLQMFVHVLGPDGSIVAQQDRLDVPAFGWRPGDIVAQVHRADLPSHVQSSEIAVGFYNPDSNMRLPVTVAGQPSGDRLLLSEARP
ncbi:hypothetical protein TFLX_02848 [Thermoflexales bacterium]|nr:hypothetical protein TFLX_02848 [Thermoflexales bacterium]